MIKRFLKGIFELRPVLPKYTSIWDVNTLLTYLRIMDPISKLSLKLLTLKTVTLLMPLTGQRCQTIHKIDLSFIQKLDNMFRITIQEPIKTSKPGKHIEPL